MDDKKIETVDAAASSAALGKKRRLKIGVLSIVSTVVVIAAVIAINFFADYLSNRYTLEVDMTSNKEYEITDETAEMLRTLSEPVTITVLSNETDYDSNADLAPLTTIFQRYAQLSEGNVTVSYINAVANPGVFEKYNDLGNLSEGDVIVESAKRYKALSPQTDLLEYTSKSTSSTSASSDSGSAYVSGLKAEQGLTSAILYVTAAKVPKAAYITGHGETTQMEVMDSLLTRNSFEVTTLDLLSEGSVPSDVDMLIISLPEMDYTSDEISDIDEFLNAGGDMIVSYSIGTPTLSKLDAYFEEWGVQYENKQVFDSDQGWASYNNSLLPTIVDVEGLTDGLSAGRVIVANPRLVTALWETDNWRGTQPLLTTSAHGYTKDLTDRTESFDKAEGDDSGTFNVGVLAYQNSMHNLDSTYSYVAFLNGGFLADSILKESSFLNASYFLNLLSFMSDDADTVSIASKDLTSTTLVIPSTARRVLFWILIIIIPAGLLALGVVVWVKRRHK